MTSFDNFLILIALEEFFQIVPHTLKLHITDKEETDLIKAAQLADDYVLVHRSSTIEKFVAHDARLPDDSASVETNKAGDGRIASPTPVWFFC